MKMLSSNALTVLAALCLVSQSVVEGFSVAPLQSTSRISLQSSKGDDDFPRGEMDEYTGAVDWDAEWKKVVEAERAGKKVAERPGKDFYKSDAELAAIRAAKQAQAEAQKISEKLPSMPSMNMQSLTGDWKVCRTGIIVWFF
jgi:hypothetical protein